MRQTLADMAASEKTTFVAVLYGGAALVDGACEAIGGYVVAKWKMVSAIGVVFALVQGTLIIDPVIMYLHFRFELFMRKNIGANALLKCW